MFEEKTLTYALDISAKVYLRLL